MSSRTPRFFYGFHVVTACFFLLFLCWGMVLNTFPIFVKPISVDMNWSRGALSLALLMGSVGSVLMAPIAGVLLDRIGARPVMATGAVIIGLGLLGGSLISQLWQLYIVFAVIGCGLMCSTAIPCSLVISNWFVSRRGAAMGVAFAGTSVGGMVMAPIANWIILNWDWRAAFVFSGITIIALAWFATSTEVGVFVVIVRTVSVFPVAMTAFNMIVAPMVAEAYGRGETTLLPPILIISRSSCWELRCSLKFEINSSNHLRMAAPQIGGR